LILRRSLIALRKNLKTEAKYIITEWAKTEIRDFPWRSSSDPYMIMIAEFMLQRTKANQVVPVYEEFILRYPDVITLAKANEKTVVKFTEHLGLHKRGTNFINAAKFIVNKYGGSFPSNREELLKIPGVGDYVAGAIMAVCFKNVDYVVDSNIARFINRYYGLELTGEIRRKKEIIEKAKGLFQVVNPGEFLFALIDFTSLICKPRNPLCSECPVKKIVIIENTV